MVRGLSRGAAIFIPGNECNSQGAAKRFSPPYIGVPLYSAILGPPYRGTPTAVTENPDHTIRKNAQQYVLLYQVSYDTTE